ncbi:hypothetical protein [Psychrobacter sp. FDAARGOS_221]|uniref:hypothetical protein n=1 Tax=Psychrobacter sp. FDAARGOS_221 TaxID=1975705 RepID=UPI000BB58DA1|nr:hypothetical protein [Psychrobacter sp. FDAARGOS_221]PNK59462.1 hypothetical protein A6J60_000205 [Psychrobacter sp. FDAARGOS_221]PNK59922.1 hypothetical protein A6J60_002855 [Psychrobacter sp. FDAARGOS_221]PNK61469.1 hypothetical protein A6J60_011740 [Psychrobacter sp. FDAARGOS_221]
MYASDEQKSAQQAIKDFNEVIRPIIANLSLENEKKGYAKALFILACHELAAATGDKFEFTVDFLTSAAKSYFEDHASQTPSEPS